VDDERHLAVASADALYGEVRALADNERMERKDRLVRLRQILEEAVQEALEGDPGSPAGDLFQRSVYLMQQGGVSPRIQRRVHALREVANRSAHELAFVPTETQERHAVGAVCELIAVLSGVPVPVALQAYCGMDEEALEEEQQTGGPVEVLRAVVLDAGQPSQGIGKSGRPLWYKAARCVLDEPDEGVETTVLLTGPWAQTPLWPYAVLSATACVRSADGRISTTRRSLVAVEPDVLVEATTVASCFSPGLEHPNAELALVRRFQQRETSWQAVAGNIANALFDCLVAGATGVDVEAFIEEELRRHPMALLSLAEQDVELVRASVRAHVGGIRRAAERARALGEVAQEVFLGSSRYGLQGRIDALVTGRDMGTFDVLELKNGAVPHELPGSVTEVRSEHAAQVWCYELLVQSALGRWPRSADVVYLADEQHGWRSAMAREPERVRLLATRNELVAQEHRIGFEGDVSLVDRLCSGTFGRVGRFDSGLVGDLSAALMAATPLERAYVAAFAGFLERERWTADTGAGGDNGHGGFAALWRTDLAQKEDRLAVLSSLHVAGADPASGLVTLVQVPLRPNGTGLREGDGVLLYRQDGPDAQPLAGPLLKGVITAIDHHRGRVTVSLYNRYATLDASGLWALEADASGGLISTLYSSLFQLLQASAARRALLMGAQAPRFGELPTVHPGKQLTPHQQELLRRALSAQDYFLMQGPPGSGKTSIMMVELVRHLMRETSEVVLLLAYTNRAVGEMCAALAEDRDPAVRGFVVFGRDAGDGTQVARASFSRVAQEEGAQAVLALVHGSRIVAATVAMCTQHPEILAELRRRGVRVTAIVDEAAQLLEPQVVGILAQVDRAILIGDERQLPAVVQQPAAMTAVTDASLLEAGFVDLRMSLFERLLRRCTQQGWDRAVGMLTDQGRMHEDIMAFPNDAFYEGRLRPLYGWQSSHAPLFHSGADGGLERALAERRVLFLPSAADGGPLHVHEQEAQRVATIVQLLARRWRLEHPDFDPGRDIGVITPFRAQAACIYRHLPEELQDLTVDTVERYQGGERDIIIVSFAVHTPAQMPAVMALSWNGAVDRKLNVMLTRARQQLILLGDPDVLLNGTLPDGTPSHQAVLVRELQQAGAWVETSD
jgi:DNA replication ATP-dependent helicase Dna2